MGGRGRVLERLWLSNYELGKFFWVYFFDCGLLRGLGGLGGIEV